MTIVFAEKMQVLQLIIDICLNYIFRMFSNNGIVNWRGHGIIG